MAIKYRKFNNKLEASNFQRNTYFSYLIFKNFTPSEVFEN